jgi:alkanesulfonate monooxygenase SsuD/methylene tetrahydromethanopterin reductase-like flavin-dependent oxidoreductase (luciferase family)
MRSLQDFGVMLEPQLGMKMKDLVETAKFAEKLGFGYLFRSDHLLPTDDRRGLDSPECWTSMGAIAASTRDIRFGPMVSPIGFRNPAMLAKMALTVHSYSGGRLQLGIGAGWYEAEYRAHGYEFPDFAVRARQFSESLEIIRTMVREDRVDFDGEYFSAHTDCFPRPSGRVHLIIGGRSEKVVRNAARYADEWNFFTGKPEEYRRARAAFEEARQERGVEVSETGPFMLGRTESELEEHAGVVVSKLPGSLSSVEYVNELRKSGAPCGTADEFVEQIGARVDSGISKFYFQFLAPEDRPLMELLADTLAHGL